MIRLPRTSRIFLLAVGMAALSLPASAQAPDQKSSPYRAPRTSFGDPDLQGLWSNASVTTLERLTGASSLVMTPQEAARIEAAYKGRLDADSAPTNPNAGAPRAGAGVGGYNNFWLDLGAKLAVVKGEIRTSWVVDPPSGRVPYTELGRREMNAAATSQWRNFDNPEARSMGERCIVGYGGTSGPPMLNVLYNNNYQIVQSPGFVTIVVEMNHDARIIRIGGEHPPQGVKVWMGDSVGRWEGDTLVVETRNLHPGQSFTADIRHRVYIAPDAKVTERFTRVGENEILYEFAVEEPKSYTQVWRGEIPFRAAKGPMYEYACHEGNYSLANILSGARVEEKAAAARGTR